VLIQSEEFRRFESLLSDIEGERLPKHLALDALQAFFSENPHLLKLEQFDEQRFTRQMSGSLAMWNTGDAPR